MSWLLLLWQAERERARETEGQTMLEDGKGNQAQKQEGLGWSKGPEYDQENWTPNRKTTLKVTAGKQAVWRHCATCGTVSNMWWDISFCLSSVIWDWVSSFVLCELVVGSVSFSYTRSHLDQSFIIKNNHDNSCNSLCGMVCAWTVKSCCWVGLSKKSDVSSLTATVY